VITCIRNDGDVAVLVNGREIEVQDADDHSVWAECDIHELGEETGVGFPAGVTINIHSEDGFGTFLFHEVNLSEDGNQLSLSFVCHHPNKYWEGRFGLATLLDAIQQQVKHHAPFAVSEIELEDDWKRLVLTTMIDPAGVLRNSISTAAEEVGQIIKEAEISLAGMVWKKEYEEDEALFCTEVLAPLLRRMGFLSVRYNHGVREYGKDFTFSEMTPFSDLRHYGLQAKAGDVSGGVNASIDEIIGQVNDAFAMPYYELGAKDPRYISTFVVAISGRFTENAKEKIAQKIPKGLIGSVLFLDRERIIEFIERYWLREK
jgi:hypothetical protein